MTESRHTYPVGWEPGTHWAVTEAWGVLDMLSPGAIPEETRILLAGAIAGTLTRLAQAWWHGAQPPVDPRVPPPEDTP